MNRLICWIFGHQGRVVQLDEEDLGVICSRCDRVIACA